MSSSPGQGREASVNGSANGNNVDEKPRLSEHEKKANHIASGTSSSSPHFLSGARLTSFRQNKNDVKLSEKALIALQYWCLD